MVNINETTTTEILEFLKEHMLTKEEGLTKPDAERIFATKDDLTRFATKDDLKNFATKDDLKESLDALEKRFVVRFDILEGDLSYIKHELSDIKTRLEKIEKRLTEDTNVLFLEVEKLKKRISILEAQLRSRT